MMQEVEKYINQILDAVCKKEELDQIIFDITEMEERLGYRTVFKTEGSVSVERQTLIKDEIKRISSKILKDCFSPLVDQGDLRLFEPGIFKVLAEELNKKAKIILFYHLTIAIELTRDELLALSDRASHKLGRWVKVDTSIDRTIIGGAVIRKDNYIFDFSLKTKLNKLGAQWKKSIEKAREFDD